MTRKSDIFKALTNDLFIEYSDISTNIGDAIVPIITVKPKSDNTLMPFNENKKVFIIEETELNIIDI
ncbi:hypothetical protein KUA55_03025 [Enterococcus sp. ALS3]|uniref:Uncharacterized protein n=1 Tax=Enterococcus alishanensis TaxID=1303817 RepID=A0ABS6T9Q1_9ENTE|nr:hypothetical protein [Enterococcus alishanensis]MBV7389637.1 hypothetical protein [Enterococcus alishanensis]